MRPSTIGIALLAIALSKAAVGLTVTTKQATQPVSSSAPGWVWSGADEYDDPDLIDGTGRAERPGSYGAYTFRGTGVSVYVMSGPSVVIDGRSHKLGNLKVSIDGHERAVAIAHGDTTRFHVAAFEATDLTDAVHVIQLEPDAGWVVVEGLNVLSVAQSEDEPQDASPKEIPAVIPEGDYCIALRSDTGFCLDVWERHTDNGTPMQVYPTNRTGGIRQPNQWFHITPLGSAGYVISPLSITSRCLTVLAATSNGGAIAGISDYQGSGGQIWRITLTDGIYCRISPSNSPKVALTAYAGNIKQGAVTCLPWEGNTNQQWTLQVN